MPFDLFTLVLFVFVAIFGSLIGSFANVVIYRVPAGKSVVFPRSRCPHCGRALTALDLVPVFSWLFLRARCRSCHQPIAGRYPAIEALMALGFVLLVWRFPLERYGLTVLPLWVLFAMLLMLAMIDIDHYLLPDSLTLPALAVALLGSWLYDGSSGLPTFSQALGSAALAAGIIALINRIGGLVLRRFRDTQERLQPIGMDQLNLAALIGAVAGWPLALLAALLAVLVNLKRDVQRLWRLPEPWLYGLWLLALLALPWNPWLSVWEGLWATAVATGVVAILGALYWWLYDLRQAPEDNAAEPSPGDDEPVAMGFGDVKLAAVLGALLGWQWLLVALFLAFIFGALGGIVASVSQGNKLVPFGPYLVLGGLVSLFVGEALLSWYLGLLGLV